MKNTILLFIIIWLNAFCSIGQTKREQDASLHIEDLIYLSEASNAEAKEFLISKGYVFNKDDINRKWYYYDYNNLNTGTFRVVKGYGSYTLHKTDQWNEIPESLFYQTAVKRYIEEIENELIKYKNKTEVSKSGINYTFYLYKNKKISTSTSNLDNIIILTIYK